MNRPAPMSQVCEQGLHHQCQGHDAIGGCRCPNPAHTVAHAAELRASVQLLRSPYNCLPLKDEIADLLDVIGEFADEYGIHEHVDGEPCGDFACRIVVAARKLARAHQEPDPEPETARPVDGTTGGTPTDTTQGTPS